jgi:hypothetical protein
MIDRIKQAHKKHIIEDIREKIVWLSLLHQEVND